MRAGDALQLITELNEPARTLVTQRGEVQVG